jgi:hypothetical protein
MCKRELEIYLERGSETTFSNGKRGNSRRSETTLSRKRRGMWRRLFRMCYADSEDEATFFLFRYRLPWLFCLREEEATLSKYKLKLPFSD